METKNNMLITNFFHMLFQKEQNPFFKPTIAGAPSVVTDTSFFKWSIFDVHARKTSKIPFPVALPLSSTNSTSFSIVINSEFIHQTNTANCAVFLTFILSSSATENWILQCLFHVLQVFFSSSCHCSCWETSIFKTS